MTTTWPLTTERLTLRPFEPADADAVWSYRGDPDVARWLGGGTDRDDFDRHFSTPSDGLTQLVVLHDGRIVGDLMLRVTDAWAQRDVAECFADNEPSWRLMERIGMRREAHTVKDALHRTLGWQDGLMYALLADEPGRPA